MGNIRVMLTYFIFGLVIICSTSCRNTNSEVVVQGKEYLKDNVDFLLSMIDKIEQIPNLHNKGHVYIKNDNYRNQKWTLRYDRTNDQYDTVQIDKNVVSKWIISDVVSDFEYDIVKSITYFKLNIENKNGRFIFLVHQKNKSYNGIKIITDTSKFNDLNSFKYQIDENWFILSPGESSLIRFKDVILHHNE